MARTIAYRRQVGDEHQLDYARGHVGPADRAET
jgi:hypothetical protein